MNKKAPAKGKAIEEYLLSTKLYCGVCGGLMVGESGRSRNGSVHFYYKCGNAKRRKGCKRRKAVRKHWIEKLVVIFTVNNVLQDDVIDRIADAMTALQYQEDTTVPALKAQLKECEKGIANLVNAIQAGILTASTKERLEQLEKEREELTINIAQAQLARPKYTKEQIVDWISQFKYGNINDPAYQKQIIETFVNSVYLYEDRLILNYNYKNGTETFSLDEVNEAFGSDLKNFAPPIKDDRFDRNCRPVIFSHKPLIFNGFYPTPIVKARSGHVLQNGLFAFFRALELANGNWRNVHLAQ